MLWDSACVESITPLCLVPRMKRLVWKDVPNPYNCTWAKGLDFKKVEASHSRKDYGSVLGTNIDLFCLKKKREGHF